MYKNVFAEKNVHDYVLKYVHNKTSAVGLIVGVSCKAEDYVVKLIRCIPKEPETKNTSNNSLFDGEWLGGMAVEISHMLPGGLNVIGLFSIASISQRNYWSNEDLHKCYEVLQNSKDLILKKYNLKSCQEISWISVNFDLANANLISCVHHDMISKKNLKCQENIAKILNVKIETKSISSKWVYQDNTIQWCYLHTNFEIDEVLNQVLQSTDPHQQLQKCIHPSCTKIADSLILMDGKLLKDDLLIETIKDPVILSEKVIKSIACKCFHLSSTLPSNINEVNYETSLSMCHLKGGIFSCVYLPATSTVKDAIIALKQDAVCSLNYRSFLTAELLEEQGLELEKNTILYFPRRYGFSENCNHKYFTYFDYVFMGEEMDIVLERIEESFDIQLSPAMVKTDYEEISSKLKIQKVIKEKNLSVSDTNLNDTENCKEKFDIQKPKIDFNGESLKNVFIGYHTLFGAFMFSAITLGFALLAFYIDAILFPSDSGLPFLRSMVFGFGNWFSSTSLAGWLTSLDIWDYFFNFKE